jgi:hypothetical protein
MPKYTMPEVLINEPDYDDGKSIYSFVSVKVYTNSKSVVQPSSVNTDTMHMKILIYSY